MKNKIVVVINGKGGVGKDTLCDFIISKYRARKISAITPIVKIARENGWNGEKNSKSRKFLSDLKRAFVEFNNLPNTYLLSEFNAFLKSDDNILFVHIREKDQIEEFICGTKDKCTAISLLVTNSSKEDTVIGNASDDMVFDYDYDVIYDNRLSLENAEADFIKFFKKLLENEGLEKIIIEKN